MKTTPTLLAVTLLVSGCAASPEAGPAPASPTSQAELPVQTPSPRTEVTPEAGPSASACPQANAVDHPERLRGINAAGGEFTHTAAGLPGVPGEQYLYPGPSLMSYLASRGHCLVRIPFRWERLQPELSGDLSESGLAELRAAVRAAGDAGLLVLMDLHNYGTHIGTDDVARKLNAGVSNEDLQDFWSKLVMELEDEPAVVAWGLMNEPTGLQDPPTGPTTWQSASQAAVDGIRATGDERTIFVAGDQWGGANDWAAKNGDPWIDDPEDDVVYEAHYYFAPDNAGAYEEPYAEVEQDAVARGHAGLHARIEDELGDFIDWLEVHDQRGFVGEIGWPHGQDEELWNAAGQHAYTLLDDAGVGATFWATGEFWSDGYRLNAYDHETLTPRAQARVIEEHLLVPEPEEE